MPSHPHLHQTRVKIEHPVCALLSRFPPHQSSLGQVSFACWQLCLNDARKSDPVTQSQQSTLDFFTPAHYDCQAFSKMKISDGATETIRCTGLPPSMFQCQKGNLDVTTKDSMINWCYYISSSRPVKTQRSPIHAIQ